MIEEKKSWHKYAYDQMNMQMIQEAEAFGYPPTIHVLESVNYKRFIYSSISIGESDFEVTEIIYAYGACVSDKWSK